MRRNIGLRFGNLCDIHETFMDLLYFFGSDIATNFVTLDHDTHAHALAHAHAHAHAHVMVDIVDASSKLFS